MEPTPRTAQRWNDDLELVFGLARRTVRKWRPALITFLLVAVAAGAFIKFWPRQYRSEAVVLYREGMQWTSSEAPNPRRVGQRLRDSLLARALLTKVIEEMNLYPRLVKAGRMMEAVEEMRLAVQFRIDQSDVYVLSYLGDSPKQAQQVTARLTELLIGENARLRSEQAQVAGSFLEAEKKRNEAELAAKEGALLRFLARHPEFATEQSPLGGSLRARARRESAPGGDRESDALAALRREEDRLRRQLSNPGQARAPQDPTLVTAKEEAEAKLRTAQRELSEKRSSFTEQHPDVRAAEAAVRSAQEGYRRALESMEAAEPRVLNERLNQVQQEIAAFRRTQAQGRPALPDPSTSTEAAQRIVANEAEWARLSREAAEARERFQQLETRQFVASMTASMAASGQSSQIIVIDPAFLPAQPVGRSRTTQAIIGLALALVLGVGVAFLLALSDDVVREAADVERLQLGAVLLDLRRRDLPTGAVPGDAGARPGLGEAAGALTPGRKGGGAAGKGGTAAGKSTALVLSGDAELAGPGGSPAAFVRVHRFPNLKGDDPRLVMLNAPESAAAAAFRVLRHRLRERGDPRTILVTSAARSEGKSFCAANLALALGEGDRARVLLLEANFRSPFLAQLFGFTPPACAGEQLEAHRQQPGQQWEAVETVVPSLHTLAISPGSTARPLLDRALDLCVAAFRLAGYDYIVIDGPDVLGSADVNLMQETIDGMLIVVRGRSSRGRDIRAAIGQIGSKNLAGFTLLGS